MKTMEATGGSLADGVIELSYTRTPSETSIFDEQDALKTATKRCKAWGFKKADAFSGEQTSCRDQLGSRCDVYMVTKKYQCVGKG
ncbi:YecR family lipoprotein [Shewanella sp. YLB-07]|nr:YecR family lipoprotein [Shewanella sp. YLB-07]